MVACFRASLGCLRATSLAGERFNGGMMVMAMAKTERSGSVIGIDRNIVVGEVTGPDRGLCSPPAQGH